MTVFATPFHLRIFRVALLPPDQAVPEWEILRAQLDLDTLQDQDAIKLLPLVYRALVNAGFEDPNLARLKGMLRRSWYDNQRLFHRVGAVLDAFEERGIRAMLLKGVALTLLCYPEIGLRPMVDADVLVEPAHAAEAVAALEQAGWVSDAQRDHPWNLPYGEQPLHELTYRQSEMYPIDLHWRFVPWVARDGSGQDPGLWAQARPVELAGHRALAPSPEDLLLLVILHAHRTGWARAPRWVADATYLLRSLGPELDWDRFTARTVHGRLVEPVREALEFVHDQFDAPVPPGTLDALRRTRIGRWQQRRYRLASRQVPLQRGPVLGDFTSARISWARWSLNLTPVATVRSLPMFVTRRLGLQRPSEIPAAVVTRGARNVKNATRGATTR